MIKAEVVADSVSPRGKRITTFKVRYPWIIHGEVMTHRVLSRNASSNRAIPLRKMLEEARSDELRAEPVYWGAEQKGMEPGGELDNIVVNQNFGMTDRQRAREIWRDAAIAAAREAEAMSALGVHKSLCNRLLMPFTHANVVLTATEWDNFFGLRLDKAADPTMRALAVAMWEVYNIPNMETMQARGPRLLQPGEWHLPFVDMEKDGEFYKGDMLALQTVKDIYLKVSVARCARVSYESFETGRRSTVEEDLKLYDRLLAAQPLHASPAEHQATPDVPYDWGGQPYLGPPLMAGDPLDWSNSDEWGNFIQWRQYRKMLPGEAVAPLPEAYR